jgi:hypothetical protein
MDCFLAPRTQHHESKGWFQWDVAMLQIKRVQNLIKFNELKQRIVNKDKYNSKYNPNIRAAARETSMIRTN